MYNKIYGLLLGSAVGDSLGLPFEGLSPARAQKLFNQKQVFLLNKGMISDDTEHMILVALALYKSQGNKEIFIQKLSHYLRLWFIALPPAIGLATLQACIKLWIPFIKKTGVSSAGNGPAMRAAIIGLLFAHDTKKMHHYITISTKITHTDNRALVGAKTIASLIGWIIQENITTPPDPMLFSNFLSMQAPADKEWQSIIKQLQKSLQANDSVFEFAQKLGLEKGITGYIYHTVPMVLYAWYHHFNDYKATITALITCGGDTDTTCAIAGALTGMMVTEENIPPAWKNIAFYPYSIEKLQLLAKALTEKEMQPEEYISIKLLGRNFLFIGMLFLHILRRMLPPYK